MELRLVDYFVLGELSLFFEIHWKVWRKPSILIVAIILLILLFRALSLGPYNLCLKALYHCLGIIKVFALMPKSPCKLMHHFLENHRVHILTQHVKQEPVTHLKKYILDQWQQNIFWTFTLLFLTRVLTTSRLISLNLKSFHKILLCSLRGWI